MPGQPEHLIGKQAHRSPARRPPFYMSHTGRFACTVTPPLLCPAVLCCAFHCCLPAAASYVVYVNAVSGTTPEGDALLADGPYGMWSLDAEQVCTSVGPLALVGHVLGAVVGFGP